MAGIELRLLSVVNLAGGPFALPGEKEIQEDNEKTSTDEQEARVLGRLRTVTAYIFSHVRHDVRPALFMAVRRETAWKPGEGQVARG